MLENLKLDDFSARIGATFSMQLEEGNNVDVTLIEASSIGRGRDEGRDPFRLVFRGPQEPIYPQRIYRLEVEGTEPLEIFLVPIGRDANGVSYEAIFN